MQIGSFNLSLNKKIEMIFGNFKSISFLLIHFAL